MSAPSQVRVQLGNNFQDYVIQAAGSTVMHIYPINNPNQLSAIVLTNEGWKIYDPSLNGPSPVPYQISFISQVPIMTNQTVPMQASVIPVTTTQVPTIQAQPVTQVQVPTIPTTTTRVSVTQARPVTAAQASIVPVTTISPTPISRIITSPEGQAFEAARTGNVDELERLAQQGILPSVAAMNEAAANGHEDVIRWGDRHGILPNREGASRATENGHTNVVRWLFYRKIYPDPRSMDIAIARRHAGVAVFLYENAFYPQSWHDEQHRILMKQYERRAREEREESERQ